MVNGFLNGSYILNCKFIFYTDYIRFVIFNMHRLVITLPPVLNVISLSTNR